MTWFKLMTILGLVAELAQCGPTKHFIEPDDDSVVDSFSTYISMESDFYAKNAKKMNDVVVFVSEDLIRTNHETINETIHLLSRSVLLSVSSYLNDNFLCSLKQNLLLANECKRKESGNSNYARFNRPVRIVGRAISPAVDFAQIRKLYNQIEESYFKSFNVKREDKILHSVLIIAQTSLISMFKLLFSNFNVPIVALDVHSFTYRLNLGVGSEKTKVITDTRRDGFFAHTGPNLRHLIEIGEHFRALTKLERMHVYVSNFDEKFEIMENRKRHGCVKTVESIDILIQSLRTIDKHTTAELSSFSPPKLSLKKNNTSKIRFKVTKRDNSRLFKPAAWLKQKTNVQKSAPLKNAQRHISKVWSLENVEPIFDSNDLIIIKSKIGDLLTVINTYQMLKERHFKLNIITSKKNYKFYRYILWIPEQTTPRSLNLNVTNTKQILSAINKITAFKVFVLNWHLDVDWSLSKLIDQVVSKRADFGATFNSAGKYTLKLINSDPNVDSNLVERLQFRISDNNLIVNDDLVKRATVLKRVKPTYRIVSSRVEPFVIVSQLDEHLVSKDECKDGLPCLDIESDIYNDNQYIFKDKKKYKTNDNHLNLSEAMSQLFSMEQTISLIKNFKYFSENNNDTEFSDRVKTKCCTGYMINLLSRMAHDLDFEFDFYFLSNKKPQLLPINEFTTSSTSSSSDEPTMGRMNHDEMSDAINHVIKGLAHMAVGPYSLTVDRLKLIDFSMPFLYSGYALLIKQEKKGVDDLFMFMKPFTYLHWGLIVFFALGSAIALAMLEFNSPFGLNPKGRQRARNYTLGSAISMVISLMFMHTMPAKSPKSWAGKWTQNFIASFALIFIATYTAQMASILSAGQESKVFKGIDDYELFSLKRGLVRGSSVQNRICKNKKEHYKSHCENSIVLPSDEAGIQSVINGSLDVYISDQILLNYMRFKETNCNLKITGENFAETGYAFGLGNEMSDKEKKDIDIQILDYFETGYLDELYNKWFNKRVKCNKKGSDDKIRIDVDQYKGVYAYLGIGILAAVVVLFLEQALYKWTIPFLRSQPKISSWKSLKLMFISQRIYRIVHSEELFTASDSAKEFLNVFKRRDFEAIFQKSFRKKQMEATHNSQLRKRPKFWALIEASTERGPKDENETTTAGSQSSEPGANPDSSSSGAAASVFEPGASITDVLNKNLQTMSKDQILILKELCNSKTFDEQEMAVIPVTQLASKNVESSSPSSSPFSTPPQKRRFLLPKFNIAVTETIVTESSDSTSKNTDRIMHIDDSSLDETSRLNQTLGGDTDLDASFIGSRTEFDDSIFQADVSTPALYEPEIFNICGSSTSLLVSKRGCGVERASSSLNVTETAESARSREYRSIHKMFGYKARCEAAEKE